MTMPIVMHDLYARHFDSLSEADRSRVDAAIRSIDISSGEPKSSHPILQVGRDYSILATPEIRLMFRPENGELHLLGLLSQSFIDYLNRTPPPVEKPGERQSASKSRPTRKAKPPREFEPKHE
jgi:hypothetical protein